MKPVLHSTDKRLLITVALGFVAYRLSVEVMASLVALTLGLIVAGCTWTLTKPRGGPTR